MTPTCVEANQPRAPQPPKPLWHRTHRRISPHLHELGNRLLRCDPVPAALAEVTHLVLAYKASEVEVDVVGAFQRPIPTTQKPITHLEPPLAKGQKEEVVVNQAR